jgi:hypothetical protein
MSDAVPALKPTGADMAPKEGAALGALQKLTPRQKELGAAKKKAKKRPSAINASMTTRIQKFDPDSPVNYKSPFMFGTPKAAAPGTDRKTFLSYKKISTLDTMHEDVKLAAAPTSPGSPLPNQGELFYEGSKWFWRDDQHVHVQIFNAAQCYVARCNALEAELEFEPLFFDKAVVEECLDLGFIVNGIPTPKNAVVKGEGAAAAAAAATAATAAGADARRNSFGDSKDLDKAAEKKAKEQGSRYLNEVAKCIIEKLTLQVDGGNKTLSAVNAASGASLLLEESPVDLKLPQHQFRVARRISIGEFKRVTDRFAADLEHARGVVASAHERASDLGDHINIWESATSCNAAEDARRHTISATQKMHIVRRLSMEANEMKLALAKMKAEDAAK